jgi:hypothetical protein
VAGVVDQHVDPACLSRYRGNRLIDGILIGYVHLDRSQRDAVLVGVRACGGSRLFVAPG